jgi:hypothetical protein
MKKKKKEKKGRPCETKEICKFLKELNVWLRFMETDYEALRKAVCNVEAKAFDNLGTQGKRFCPPGGPGGDPPPPPPPPKWE